MPANPKHKSAGTLPLGAHSKAPRPPYKGGSAVFISLRAKHECLVQILAIKSSTYWILADISHCFVWNVPKNTSQCQQSANRGPSGTIRAQNGHGARQNPAALPFEVSYPPSRRHQIFHISICANLFILYCNITMSALLGTPLTHGCQPPSSQRLSVLMVSCAILSWNALRGVWRLSMSSDQCSRLLL